MDLAEAHVKAVNYAVAHTGCEIFFGLGTGRGYSVLKVVRAFEAASGKHVPLEFVARRAGDAPELTADTSHANTALNWFARHSLDTMCADAW
jgi:UDP-glucose 4-epimerase